MLKLIEKEQIYLTALEEICKKYEMDDCCIGSSCEQKVCICKRNDSWEVFIVEKGLEFDKTLHKECVDACLEVIKVCSYCLDEFKDASKEFKNIVEMYVKKQAFCKK